MTPSTRERTGFHEAGHAVAAITFAIPIISITIDADIPHLRRGRYQPQHATGLECMGVLCLCGPASERLFCGPINDGSDLIDIEMARQHLARRFEPLRIRAELERLRASAEALVRTPWAQRRIAVIAEALLQCGTLSGEDIDAIGQHRA